MEGGNHSPYCGNEAVGSSVIINAAIAATIDCFAKSEDEGGARQTMGLISVGSAPFLCRLNLAFCLSTVQHLYTPSSVPL